MKHTGRIYFSDGSTLDIKYDDLKFVNIDPDQLLFQKNEGGHVLPIALFSLKTIAGFVYDLDEDAITL